MPLEFTVDDSPARTSGDGKAKQTAQFADQVLITNTEFSNIIEHDDTGLEIDGDAPPDHSINLPTQEASCELHTLETASASVDSHSHSNSNSDGDGQDKDIHIVCGKRKRPSPTNTVRHKRHSRTLNPTSKRHLERATHSARRQKPSSFHGMLLSNRPSVPQHGRKRGRRSVRPPPFNTENAFTSLTLPQPHAPPEQVQQQLPKIVIYPLLSSTAFLTTIFRSCGDMGMLSASQAVSLLENQVGHGKKLENTTLTPLAPGPWFLTCFLYWPSDAVNPPASRGQLNSVGSN
ncbi:hypothetical protein K432DRAFT_408466 [Lepidopterella palustris CBS 459.81]|uniref:Uncharacterized protein n=1 Tax=Lepidopterella palustris CBS 459.81 TaxID=1314670 RepID=A0A8E2JBA3_9PEZI|nr:hypothetical protein K432DRAFT_408466 [Lepidopterella palustris CBS 459.81]